MTRQRTPSSSSADCPPASPVRRGPIVRMEDTVRRLQEAAGIPEGSDRDGLFGEKTARALRERYGDLTDRNNPAFRDMPQSLRNDIAEVQRRLGPGMFRQGQDNGCVVQRSGIQTDAAPAGLRERFAPQAEGGRGRGGEPREPKYLPDGRPNPAAIPPELAATSPSRTPLYASPPNAPDHLVPLPGSGATMPAPAIAGATPVLPPAASRDIVVPPQTGGPLMASPPGMPDHMVAIPGSSAAGAAPLIASRPPTAPRM